MTYYLCLCVPGGVNGGTLHTPALCSIALALWADRPWNKRWPIPSDNCLCAPLMMPCVRRTEGCCSCTELRFAIKGARVRQDKRYR